MTISGALPSPLPDSNARQLTEEINDLRQLAEAEANKIDGLQNGVNNLQRKASSIESQIILACNNDRKMKSSAAVRRDFEDNLRYMGKETREGKTLQIFCTAATTYLDYQSLSNADSGKRVQGFPTDQTTEIPQLRDWLHRLTVPSRERRAEAILANIELLIGSMKPWIDDRSGDLKMTLPQRQEGELTLEARLEELRQASLSFCGAVHVDPED